MDDATLALPRDASAPRLARDFVTHVACEEHHQQVGEMARLLVSELVTNVVRHALDPLVVHVECHEEQGLLVRVDDGGPSDLTPRRQSIDDFGGRGLQLVEVISDDWGVAARPGSDGTGSGKTVWFRLGVTATTVTPAPTTVTPPPTTPTAASGRAWSQAGCSPRAL